MIIAASFSLDNAEMLNNRGLQYGDGLFESMRMCAGQIPLFDLHMERLAKGLKKLQLKPISRNTIEQSIEHACGVHLAANCVLKLVVFRAAQNRGYAPMTNDVSWFIVVDNGPGEIVQQGLALALAERKLSIQPMLAGIKHLSRLEQVMIASELSKLTGVDDLLVLNHDNQVIETTYQNVVFIKHGRLFTPKLNQCGVKGVALKWLKSKYNVKSKKIHVKEVSDFEGLLVCNAIRGFRAVRSIQGLPTKEVISFSTSLPIQDKISNQWEALFNS